MVINIRDVGVSDLTLLSNLGKSIYRSHFSHVWDSESELTQFLDAEYSYSTLERSLQELNTSWYLAENRHPIGFAKITWGSALPDMNVSGALLNKLYIKHDETGNNYGKIMFERFVDLAQCRGEKFFWLEVFEQNERAYSFYERQGMSYIKDSLFKNASQQIVLKIMGMRI